MNKLCIALVGAFILASPSITVELAHAQAKKKPAAKKPAAKKPAPKKAGGPVVLGTTQLPGEFGKLGTTYTIGKRNPINFTLKSADYSVIPI